MTFTNVYGTTIGSSSASGSLNSQAIVDMANLGVTWLRYQIPWHLIDATGTTNQNTSTYTWNAWDSAVSQCNAAGINILLTIMQAPSQFIDGGSPGNPLNPSHTATFAGQIASRYNGGAHGTVNAIEIGNEDYNSGSDTTSIPVPLVQSLAATMKTCYPAIKAVSSSILVGVACKLQRNSAGYTAFFDTLLKPSTGPYISSVFQGDYLNFHYYTAIPTSGGIPVELDPTVDMPSWNGGQGLPSITHAWQLIQAKMSLYSVTSLPIWLTEYGPYINTNPGRNSAGVVSQATQWAYYKDILDSVRTSGVVAKNFFFTLGYYTGYPAPNYRDGASLVQGTSGSPQYTTAYTNLKGYISANPTWGSGGTGGALVATPSTLSFTGIAGGANPANQTVSVQNTDTSSATYSVSDDMPWLTVSPTSGTIGAGASASFTISCSTAGLAAGTFTGTITWTAGALSVSVGVTLTVSSAAPPPGITALTAYFANAASPITPTADQIYTILGAPTNVNTATTLGAALGWGEVNSQGSTGPWASALFSGGPPGPSGNGFLWGARTLSGNQLQAGTYTAAVRLNIIGVGAVSITADIHVRLWLWNAASGYTTLIADCVQSGQTVLTTKSVFTPSASTSGVTPFNTGDKLYIDILLNVLSNSNASTAQVQLNDLSTDTVGFTGMSTANVLTPGYSSTGTGGGGGGGGGTTGTPLSLTISDVPFALSAGSLLAKSMVGRRGELSATVYDETGSTHIQQYQRTTLYDQTGNQAFTGYVTSPVESKPSGIKPLLVTSLTVTDQHYLADKRVIAQFYRNQTTGFIAQDIVTNWLSEEGVTVGSIAPGIVVPIANFGYCTIADALDALVAFASSSGIPHYWMIDQNKAFWLVPYTSITGPTADGTTIDDGTLSGVVPTVTRANPLYRNIQYAVGGVQETPTQDETRAGDGQTRTFAFSYPLNAAPSIFTLNGVAKTLGVKGQSSYNYYYATGDNTIVQDSGQTVLVSTDRLRMVYVGQVPAVFTAENTAQIQAQGNLDGTSGRIEAVITDTTITSLAQGTATVGQALTIYCKDGTHFTFGTQDTRYQPGQLITVNYPPFGFSEAGMLVTEVDISDQVDGLMLWYTVNAVQGPYDVTWQEFFGNMLKAPGQNLASSISLGVVLPSALYPSTSLWPSSTLYPSG